MSLNAIAASPIADRWRASLLDYLALARLDHSTKHVFIIPGFVLAYVLRGPQGGDLLHAAALGLLSAVLIASANYVINEWLDREFDAFHPAKSARTCVSKALLPQLVYLEYGLFLVPGLICAALVAPTFLVVAAGFALSGLVYNVRPLRTKDRAYVDVLSESINNPIRLMLGWAMVDPYTIPPSSLIIAYWMGGAFLMGTKRLSEYRDITAAGGIDLLHRYRRSFQRYSEHSLLISSFLYAILSAFFIAVFLIKYRIEYVLALPAFASLFALYLALSLKRDSVAQKPERLMRETRLMLVAGATVALLAVLTFTDIPGLKQLSSPHYIDLTLTPG